jgi:hypothetical protein
LGSVVPRDPSRFAPSEVKLAFSVGVGSGSRGAAAIPLNDNSVRKLPPFSDGDFAGDNDLRGGARERQKKQRGAKQQLFHLKPSQSGTPEPDHLKADRRSLMDPHYPIVYHPPEAAVGQMAYF